METVLIVITGEEPDQTLLDEANRHITGLDAKALVCRVADEGFHQRGIQRHMKAGKEVENINKHAAERSAAEIAEATFGEEVPYETFGVVGESVDDILDIANGHDCDHIFINAERRTPVGKAIFGDLAQGIILEFDGPVTVTTGS